MINKGIIKNIIKQTESGNLKWFIKPWMSCCTSGMVEAMRYIITAATIS